MIRAIIRFHKELSFFLSDNARDRDVAVTSLLTRSAKDLIESFGVPHVEIDSIIVNGTPVGSDYLLREGDRIEVTPTGPRKSTRFIADVHVKTVARRLRMLGFDTLYDHSMDDDELAGYSEREARALLSRDRQLLMRNKVTSGMCLRSTNPDEQLLEVLRRFSLLNKIAPFSRCITCNGELRRIAKREISDGSIPPLVYEKTETFYRCGVCGKYFWKGSHVERMLEIIEEIRRALE